MSAKNSRAAKAARREAKAARLEAERAGWERDPLAATVDYVFNQLRSTRAQLRDAVHRPRMNRSGT